MTNIEEKIEITNKNQKQEKNKLALTGFILSIISIPLYEIGIIPILAVIFSAIGLYQVKNNKKQEGGANLAIIGLIIGIIYTLMYMNAYGHL
jgi:hypothetical protein